MDSIPQCLTAYNIFFRNEVVSTNNLSNVGIILAWLRVLPHKVQCTWRKYMEKWVAQIWNSSLQANSSGTAVAAR